MIRRPPRSTLFPYTTLFRSQEPCHQHRRAYPRVSVPLLCKGQSFGCRRIDESEFPLTTLRIRGDESWRIEVEDESSDDREEQAKKRNSTRLNPRHGHNSDSR